MARKPARRRRSAPARAAAPARTSSPASAALGGYLEWGPVMGGAALSLAISAVLFNFGSTVGLSAAEFEAGSIGDRQGWSLTLGVLAAGIWVLWVPLMSAAAGGYLAGLLRAPISGASVRQVELRDGAHGLTVWAVSTIGAAAGAAVIAAITAIGADQAAVAGGQAEQARAMVQNAAVVLGFAAAAGSLLAAGAAWWMAVVGGEHRDRNVDVHQYVPRFLRA